MDHLSLQDNNPGPTTPQQGPPSMIAAPPPPPPPTAPIPQLPPQMFTTAASLLDLTDKKLLVILRDARKIIGVLRSWDQFGNLVLQDSIERIVVDAPGLPRVYADAPQGIFLVRGENTMMMGEIDLDREEEEEEGGGLAGGWERAELETVQALRKRQSMWRRGWEKRVLGGLRREGFEGERSGEAVL